MKNIIAMAVAGLLGLTCPAMAEDDWEQTGELKTSLTTVYNKQGQLAKFNEYRDVQDGADVDKLKLHLDKKDGNYYIDLNGTRPGRKDQNLLFGVGSYGTFDFSFKYDETPHNFWFGYNNMWGIGDASTLPGDVGGRYYTIPDSVQRALQDSVAAGGTGNGSTTGTSGLVNANLTNGPKEDLAVNRQSGALAFKYQFSEGLALNFDASRENRTGTRPFGGYFTFGLMREIPEPIDYVTNIMNANMSYKSDDLFLKLGYNASTFKNNIGTVSFDNPYTLVPTTALADVGRIDLYPDNEAGGYNLTFAVNLPIESRLTGYYSKGTMKQNDNFIPFTVNTAILNDATLSAKNAITRNGVAATSLDGNIDNETRNLKFNVSPLESLHLNLNYRFWSYKNNTPLVDFYRVAAGDRTLNTSATDVSTSTANSGVYRRPVLMSYEYTTYAADLGYDLSKSLKLALNYDQTAYKRHGREVENSKETTTRGALDYRGAGDMGWLFGKLSYTTASRKGDAYKDVFDEESYGYYPTGSTTWMNGNDQVRQLPMLQKYDIGDRDRTRIDFIATASPMDGDLNMTLNYGTAKDDYKVNRDMPDNIVADGDPAWLNYLTSQDTVNDLYGLTKNELNTSGIDLSWQLAASVTVSGFYNTETYKYTQRNRPGGGGTATSSTDWSMDGTDTVVTTGLGLSGRLFSSVSYGVNYIVSDAKGEQSFSAYGSSTGANITNAKLETKNKISSWYGNVDYEVQKNMTLGLNFVYEKYEVTDWALDNVTGNYFPAGDPTANSTSGNLLLGVGNNSYDVSAVSLVAKYNF
ncbi:MAG: MtrB/PioB family outer membrane beta-barrel protein [Nitrospinae bacterium]|nr:MtrB/PioB family outer membrane beta-barrel protein [Nitrospinota bacterium]